MTIQLNQDATAEDVKDATVHGFEVRIVADILDVDTTSGVFTIRAPRAFDGRNLSWAQGYVDTPGAGGSTTIQVRNLTKFPNNDALSVPITIASGTDVGTPGTVNSAYAAVSTNDKLRITVTGNPSTKAKGLTVILEFRIP